MTSINKHNRLYNTISINKNVALRFKSTVTMSKYQDTMQVA